MIGIAKKDIAVLTNEQSSAIWQLKGWNTYGTYATGEKYAADIERQVREADIIFWTSYRQYVQYKEAVKENAVHSCPYGENSRTIKSSGYQSCCIS
ncbi:MAG: hypothetical protein WDO16_14255 [Bacteroidota bacterium]